jgi:Cd2+/Zn2+-exporting ATPase
MYKAGRNLLRGQLLDENFLMSIATVGAFTIGEYPEAAAVTAVLQTGEFFRTWRCTFRRSISALMDIRRTTQICWSGMRKGCFPEEAEIGDIIDH